MSTAVDHLIVVFHMRFHDASQEDRDMISVVLQALPTDPQERQLLLDEFEARPDERFETDVLFALAQFRRHPEKVREARTRLGLDWRSVVDYPDIFSRRDQDRLDSLQDEFPMKGERFEDWIQRAMKEGLIEDGEVDSLLVA